MILEIIAVLIVIAIVGLALLFVSSHSQRQSKDGGGTALTEAQENNLPRFIQADFIELDKVQSISQFRSGAGHDFSRGTGETCRSMKHYFTPYSWASGGEELAKLRKQLDLQGKPQPPPDEKSSTYIFAPVNGKIVSNLDNHLGRELYIAPDGYPDFRIRITHIFPLPGIDKGTKIKAGQKIAYTGNSTDMVVEYNPKGSHHFVSYFEVMPDTIFARYQARGIKTRSDIIFSKAYRDAHPFQCKPNSEAFAEDYGNTQPADTNFTLTEVSPH